MVDEETIVDEQNAYLNSQKAKQRRSKRIKDSIAKDNATFKQSKYAKMYQTKGVPNARPKQDETQHEASNRAWSHDGKIQHTGIYLQHPKNSNRQRYAKRESHHKIRHYFGDLNNGRHEQKLYEYDWTIN